MYSPVLEQAWPDVEHEEPGGSDWFRSADVAEELYMVEPMWEDVTQEVLKTLMLVEKAVAAETWLDGKLTDKFKK